MSEYPAGHLPDGVDTVAIAVPDNVGRLMGKRVTAELWPAVVRDGLPMPNFHLVTGIENRPLVGLNVVGPHTGFGNGLLKPDLATLRPLPGDARTVVVIADAVDVNGQLVPEAPRSVLRRQLDRLGAAGLRAGCASELEFYLFQGTYQAAAASGYRSLVSSYHRHGDNDLLVAGFDEPLIGEIRRSLNACGIPVELSQGEGGPGQHELALAWTNPLEMADRHAVYKHAVKTLAHAHGLAATFMAKVSDHWPGSSCHIHISVQDAEGRQAVGTGVGELTSLGSSFLAGLLTYAADFTLLHAPFQNSYRRLRPGSWAPSNVSWGHDNRSSLVRTVGSGDSFRFEFRLPGADVNPYLSFAALIAAGLAGVEGGLTPPQPVKGDAYMHETAGFLPRSLEQAIEMFEQSQAAFDAFGEHVHRHFATLARLEAEAGRWVVTDWELGRGFDMA